MKGMQLTISDIFQNYLLTKKLMFKKILFYATKKFATTLYNKIFHTNIIAKQLSTKIGPSRHLAEGHIHSPT